jgi:DNA polymerase III, gamma/tau subunits
MQFSKILGHKETIENLRNMVDNNRLPHATLFTEQAGYGAISIVLATIQYMFCNHHTNNDSCGECNSCNKISKLIHPDVHFIFPLNISKTIGGEKRGEVEQFYPAWRELVIQNPYFGEQAMNEAFGIENKFGIISVVEASTIMKKLSLSSYEGGSKVMIIMFPERMNQEAANKLLKSLEEPMPGTYYFLISHNPIKIISTIISRCRVIQLSPISQSEISKKIEEDFNLPKEQADYWAKCSMGSYGKAIENIAKDEQQSNNYTTFVKILNLAIQKDLPGLFDVWGNISTLGKEKQKDFCVEACEILRKIYMIALGLEDISYSSYKEKEELESYRGE